MVNFLLLLLGHLAICAAVKWGDIKVPDPAEAQQSRNAKFDWKVIKAGARLAPRDHPVNWGKWSTNTFCGENMYIWGYQLVVKDYDKPWLIQRIDFLCYGISNEEFHHSQAVLITTNFNVSYGANLQKIYKLGHQTAKSCEYHEGPLIGYSMIQENSIKANILDGGVVGFSGICADGTERPMYEVIHKDNGRVKHNITTTCAQGQAACGYRLRYQFYKDVRSVVDVDFLCCELKRDFDSCELQKHYKVVAAVDNRENPIPTRERLEITRTIEISKRVISTQTQTWDKTHTAGITDSYLVRKVQSISRTETNNKFDRPANFWGLLRGVGDVISGFTGLVKKGIGAVIHASGLGELLNIPQLPKLVGEKGYENIVNLDEASLEYYFKDTEFAKTFKSDIGSVFAYLSDFTQDLKLQKALSFQGYDVALRGFRPLFESKTDLMLNPGILYKLIGENLSIFQAIPLFDMIRLYGLAKGYGRLPLQEMLQNGDLLSYFKLGALAKESWTEGVGNIINSDQLGYLFKILTLAIIFHPSSGLGIKFGLDKKLNLEGLSAATMEVHQKVFNSEQVEEGVWAQIFMIHALSKILGEDETSTCFINNIFNCSGLNETVGEGPEKFINNPQIAQWLDILGQSAPDQDTLNRLYAITGLLPNMLGVAEKLSSVRFRELVGRKAVREILGSTEFDQPGDITNLLGIYGINYIFGDLQDVNLVLFQDQQDLNLPKNFYRINENKA